MGKVRAKDRSRKRRPQPTGLPSVKESIQQDRLEPTGSRRTAILDQVGLQIMIMTTHNTIIVQHKELDKINHTNKLWPGSALIRRVTIGAGVAKDNGHIPQLYTCITHDDGSCLIRRTKRESGRVDLSPTSSSRRTRSSL